MASAKYVGNNFKGDFGGKSGSQAAPGFYVGIPLPALPSRGST